MNRKEKYEAHARRCMAKAAQAQDANAKLDWLLMAKTWLEMIPERQQAKVTGTRNQSADLEQSPTVASCL